MKQRTRKNLLAAAITFSLAAPVAMATDLFYEPFNIGVPTSPPGNCPYDGSPGGAGTYPFPTGWTLYNVDGLTPNAAVAYVNDAWEDREDFNFDATQCIVFSTSWYTPAGQADDWMWSPPVTLTAGAALSWRAVAYDPAYPDGYEVRVKTGDAPTLANQLTSDVILSVPSEAAAWTSHSLDISTYGGQTVYVGFRNHTTDKFLLAIDDVRVIDDSPDLAALSPPFAFTSEYARAPLGMDITPTLGVVASNSGAVTLTNVAGTATPKLDGIASGVPLTGATEPSLAVGATAALAFTSPAPYSGAGAWTTEYTLTSDQSGSEGDLANNTIEVPGITIGGNEFARWEGPATGSLGIGAGNGGELGVSLAIPVDGIYAGAHFAMLPIPPDDGMVPPTPNICPGFDYVLNLRAFDTVNNIPGEIIDTTTPVPCEYNAGGAYDVAFVHGPHALVAGTYVLTAVKAVGGPTLTLPLHDNRFVAGTTWVNWPTSPSGGWAHNEDFGATFAKTYQLSLLQGEQPIFVDGFEGLAPLPARATVAFPASHGSAPAISKTRPSRAPAPTQFAPKRTR